MILSINHQLSALDQLWPPLIKMDAAVKTKVERRFGGQIK
jgi:hypothetical protein